MLIDVLEIPFIGQNVIEKDDGGCLNGFWTAGSERKLTKSNQSLTGFTVADEIYTGLSQVNIPQHFQRDQVIIVYNFLRGVFDVKAFDVFEDAGVQGTPMFVNDMSS